MAAYNPYYSYPDQFLWRDEAYAGCMTAAGPLFLKLEELLKQEPTRDHFPDRDDLTCDEVNRAPYFPDYVESWKERGMTFSCSGMMGTVMAPTAIQTHKIYDAAVLYIPFAADHGDPKQAMNLLAQNEALLDWAAKEKVLVQFADCRESTHGAVLEKLIESQGTYRISYKPLYLDISVLIKHGLTLADVPGLIPDEWPEPVMLAERTVVDISDKLSLRQAHQHSISAIYRRNLPQWDYERHIRTLAGKRQAESMRLEYDCPDHNDSKMAAFWAERGLRYEDHVLNHEWYITVTPECAFDAPERKLPLLIVMKEARTACPASTQTAFQFYYDFIELCAQGQFVMLFFALETPDDNDAVLPDILREVMAQYPVDPSRVYLTGQSHNGYYALEFYRRHPKLIAAAATLCDPAGLQVGAVIDTYKSRAEEIVASFRAYDFPLIDINGNLENSYRDPERSPEKLNDDVFYFQNRMRAWKHRVYSREEILAAQSSPDLATRCNGVPADRTELRFVMGDEIYLSDYQNENGKWLFRYASIENTPHMIMPQMAELSWEFLRRFARNTETGESIQLF